ncbi:DUF1553 domain-containing protein [Echinicola rosea]|uniref:DUF1553 domain-containing protein n=1 Tax=Echinicola rosea TaxID=1807691 RepID=A0ABQ1V3Z5_9BACT|nr:DUF1553 domain-containing protein [Echinicola rosea]GGF36558.1 hypothetical protein GCM10011339_26390 [Echinicola rosea]
MKSYIRLIFFLINIIFWSCSEPIPPEIEEVYNDLPEQLDFNADVKPILSDKCFACHGPDKGTIKAGLQLHMAETAHGSGDSGERAIVPGKPGKSEVVRRILSQDENVVMPSPESNLSLTDREKAILVKWIKDGAEFEPHWAFKKPEKKEVPKVDDEEMVHNDIDRFVLSKLEKKGLSFVEEEERPLLLRRLSLDLTGLPPSPAEIEAFVNDQSPNAYEKQVDRLLESPHYGEKMAMDWMDVARYADTYGYQVDRYRDMSPWRTWVIESFNENMSYDQFLSWQIAGDLYPDPTKEMLLATGFNRLHPQNMEGGIVDEEFRVEYVADRASVLGQGAMAMTMACARCHDHKYDPISQKNFFEFYAYFNNLNETGQISWDAGDTPVPNMLWPNEKQEKVLAYLEEMEKNDENKLKKAAEEGKTQAEEWIENQEYQKISLSDLEGRAGRFDLNGNLTNTVTGKSGKMDRNATKGEQPTFVEGRSGKALKIDGDAWLDLKPVGIYKRNEAFSIGMWVHLPDSLKEGVLFHKNKGARLHSYKGYHLYLRDNKLELLMAHTWPDNAIEKHSVQEIPREKWIHVAMTYDGSSQAEGLKLFMNGEEMEMTVVNDNLYKDIIFGNYEDQIYKDPIEPGLKIGGRWRGFGIRNAMVDEIQVYGRQLTGLEVLAWAGKEPPRMLEKTSDQLSGTEKELLYEYYLKQVYRPYQEVEKELMQTRTALVDSTEQVPEVMIMKEMENRRQSYLLERGLYSEHGEEVQPDVPERILPMPEDYPKNRLGLAKWLFHPDHPLTSRVAVNRYWQNFFGRGIVKTSEDFGNQGELPSHPALLDYLAISFRESGWDVKALNKQIVMSATYRQSSKVAEEIRKNDPDNTYLARGPKVRLSSEMIRDNGLAASGLLVEKIGGKSVRPYQPEGLWAMNADTYVQDTGDKLYRRSLYTLWKRTVPNPTQSTFDQPNRSECTVRRQKTNTPLQALVLLNDPTFVEISKKLGEEMAKEAENETAISRTFIKLTGREPKTEELRLLTELKEKEYEKFANNPQKAKGWLEAGEYQVDPQLDLLDIAANAVVASVIINSDAAITKR